MDSLSTERVSESRRREEKKRRGSEEEGIGGGKREGSPAVKCDICHTHLGSTT